MFGVEFECKRLIFNEIDGNSALSGVFKEKRSEKSHPVQFTELRRQRPAYG